VWDFTYLCWNLTRSQRRPSPRLSASRGPPFTALSRQGGYAHILKGYFYTNLVGTLQVAARRGTRRLPFGSLLLAGATAKGILPCPSSNRRSRASESPPIACAHADSPPPNADVNSLGTIRAFPGAAASGFFPTARRAGSICRCVIDIGQVGSRFDLPSCQRPSFA
jgi:hypothetical protein